MAGAGGSFDLGGFPTAGCGCCGPPCHYSLCIVLRDPCGNLLTGCTVRFQGPGGIDETRTLDCSTSQACYADPPAGSWTVTVSRACFASQTLTPTVTECHNQTIAVSMAYPWSSLSYSDEYGSGTLSVFTCNRYTGSYTYVSTEALNNVDCYGSPRLLSRQGGSVTVDISVQVFPSCSGGTPGLRMLIRRTVRALPAAASCAGGPLYCAPLVDGVACTQPICSAVAVNPSSGGFPTTPFPCDTRTLTVTLTAASPIPTCQQFGAATELEMGPFHATITG